MSVVLITGCSSGFGKSMAARLSASGHHVYASMRNLEKRAELEEDLARRGASAEICELDVTNVSSVTRVVEAIKRDHGKLDVLVNNAGFGIAGFFEDLTEEESREQMETNFFGVQTVTRKMLPILKSSTDAKIINISSLSGFIGFPGMSAYHSSKWALEGFSECLRFELLPLGIKVHIVQPGSYNTKIYDENGRTSVNTDHTNARAMRIAEIVLGRPKSDDIEEIAHTVERIIGNKLTAFRIRCGRDAKLLSFARKYLPFALLERAILRQTKAGS